MENKSWYVIIMVRVVLVCLISCFRINYSDAGTEIKKVKISSPSDGDVFHPGDKVVVKVDASQEIDMVLITAGPYAINLDKNYPYELEFTIPQDAALGQIGILAASGYGKGQVFADKIDINIRLLDSSKKITSLKVYPDIEPILLGSPSEKGAEILIKTYGISGDGIEREITLQYPGIKYESSDKSVFVIDYSGENVYMRSKNIGNAYLIITCDSIAKKVKVIVE